MITEFEHEAHQLVSRKGNVSGSDLNALWTALQMNIRAIKLPTTPDRA